MVTATYDFYMIFEHFLKNTHNLEGLNGKAIRLLVTSWTALVPAEFQRNQ